MRLVVVCAQVYVLVKACHVFCLVRVHVHSFMNGVLIFIRVSVRWAAAVRVPNCKPTGARRRIPDNLAQGHM